jgi:hypothetical protein
MSRVFRFPRSIQPCECSLVSLDDPQNEKEPVLSNGSQRSLLEDGSGQVSLGLPRLFALTCGIGGYSQVPSFTTIPTLTHNLAYKSFGL